MSNLSMLKDSTKPSSQKFLCFQRCNNIRLNDRHDRARALDILVKDLKAFAVPNEELYKEMTQLLTLDDFRYESSSIAILNML